MDYGIGLGGSTGYGPVKCAYCNATGREADHPCPTCGGTGYNYIGQGMGFTGMGGQGMTGIGMGGGMPTYLPERCGHC